MGYIVDNFCNFMEKALFWGKKHAPEISIGVGLACGAAATALSSYASTKVKDIVDEAKVELNDIEDISEELEDPKKERSMVYIKTAGKIAKNYAPAIGLSVLSVSAILYGAGLLNKRNVSLSMGLAAATHALKDYRKEVVDRYGEEVDKEIRYGIKTIEETSKIVDDNGKTKTVKNKLQVLDKEPNSNPLEYTRIFDWCNPFWDNDLDANLYFIRSQQYIYNNLLVANRHVFLNTVLESLGFPPTKAGQNVGWVYNPEDPNSDGDNYIDFSIFVTDVPIKVSDGSIQYRKAIALDFNVDGDIMNKVDWDNCKERRYAR